MSNDLIVVAGDVTIDWMSIPRRSATRAPHGWQRHDATPMYAQLGGAYLLEDLIRQGLGERQEICAPSRPDVPTATPPGEILHSLIALDTFPATIKGADAGERVYRVKALNGFAGSSSRPAMPLPCAELPDAVSAGIVVLDDAANGFRDHRAVWPEAIKTPGRQPRIVYKASEPLASGLLWDHILCHHSDRTTIVVSANDLRREGAYLSRRLSWERTAEEAVWQIENVPKLRSLSECADVIVMFGLDGALHSRRTDDGLQHQLYFDPLRVEGGFLDEVEGSMIGLTSAFAASIVAHIAARLGRSEDLGEAIRCGLAASRRLLLKGFGSPEELIDPDEPKRGTRPCEPRYPSTGIVDAGIEDWPEAQDVRVPSPPADIKARLAEADSWSILGAWHVQREPDFPLRIVQRGLGDHAGAPRAQFGGLVTVDRSEIESYHAIRNLIREYLRRPKVERPLCLAVFGPPGSGKSFGVKQIAKSIGGDTIDSLTFNVAQFESTTDLAHAFSRVRDTATFGKVPLVFFDEFDCNRDREELAWLKYFLEPMQDAIFTDGGVQHPLPRCILVFAGGTRRSFGAFRDNNGSSTGLGVDARFEDAKGPDFVSRLRGFIDVVGPDPKEGPVPDGAFRLRRALILRSMLQRAGLVEHGVARVDEGIVRAMINVPRYRHGVRSMEAILEMSLLTEDPHFGQAALPAPSQLEMHVDSADEFLRLMLDASPLEVHREAIAERIHAEFVAMHKRSETREPDAPEMQEWTILRDDFKASNRQQASMISGLLAEVNCEICPLAAAEREADLEPLIERLAEAEHERWIAERRLAGWVLGAAVTGDSPEATAERVNRKRWRRHWDLLPWLELSKETQEYDLNAVRAFPKILGAAGLAIVERGSAPVGAEESPEADLEDA